MRILVILLLLLWQGAAAPSLRAQCLGLSDLLAIGTEPTALTTPQVVTAHLTFEWTFTGPTAALRETFWTVPAPDGGSLPPARLTLRPQRPGQDVVLKTTQANCVRELTRELKSRKLTAQPVTCPSCEAIRFQGVGFEATIYSKMKGDYPYVVVVHQVPASISPPAAANGPAGVKTP
ncbi:hypothetical protein [Hymenobacter terricola]|uniref:hypothetical protein n=1 Tax=Hymenobacter terricola TaxID=2819236 RepID=UPI001B30CF33|nr:hypothetical protein [Hymenobacter terricola]